MENKCKWRGKWTRDFIDLQLRAGYNKKEMKIICPYFKQGYFLIALGLFDFAFYAILDSKKGKR